MKQIKTFRVPNMSCDGCVRTIESELRTVPGVTNVVVDLMTQTVVAEWDDPATWQDIEHQLEEIEYPPQRV